MTIFTDANALSASEFYPPPHNTLNALLINCLIPILLLVNIHIIPVSANYGLVCLLVGLNKWFSNELIFAHRKQIVLFLFLRELATYVIL